MDAFGMFLGFLQELQPVWMQNDSSGIPKFSHHIRLQIRCIFASSGWYWNAKMQLVDVIGMSCYSQTKNLDA